MGDHPQLPDEWKLGSIEGGTSLGTVDPILINPLFINRGCPFLDDMWGIRPLLKSQSHPPSWLIHMG